MAETENSQEKNSPRPSVFASRRQFIQLGVAAAGAAWVGTLVQAGLFPQETIEEAEPVEIPMSELPVGAARPLTYGGTPAILIRTAESIKAFSLVCTHLGCLVQWQADKKEFYCPCHDGRFDQFGEVVAGPPPVPLEEFPVAVEEDRVIVGELV
jgi:cytochrome b6-f complex iron-sulfur subunit